MLCPAPFLLRSFMSNKLRFAKKYRPSRLFPFLSHLHTDMQKELTLRAIKRSGKGFDFFLTFILRRWLKRGRRQGRRHFVGRHRTLWSMPFYKRPSDAAYAPFSATCQHRHATKSLYNSSPLLHIRDFNTRACGGNNSAPNNKTSLRSVFIFRLGAQSPYGM